MKTAQVAVLFVFGATMARYRQRLHAGWTRLGQWRWILFAFSLFFYFGLPISLSHGHLRDFLISRGDLVYGLGAMGIILTCLYEPKLAGMLESRVPEYLGRISYSLYLVHSIVLFTTLDLLYGRLPNAAIFLIYLALSFALAHLSCIWVEEPSIRLGKHLSRCVDHAMQRAPSLDQTLPQSVPESS
jgi:peptidoglycan/LPS O-acetylase OafA/YrhL